MNVPSAITRSALPLPTRFDQRTPIADSLKRQIEAEFTTIPADKRGALIVVADVVDGKVVAHLHVAAKLNDTWKVAAHAGKEVRGYEVGVSLIGVW